MKRTALLILIFFFATSSVLAAPTIQVSGNPIGRQDNYTINTNAARWIDIQCTLTNAGSKPADLTFWTNPDMSTPTASVHLKKTDKIRKRFRLQLKKKWWCQIHTPKRNPTKWAYCTFFSISDATIVKYRPFKTWDKTIHSKDTTYHCRLLNPNRKVSFFRFEKSM